MKGVLFTAFLLFWAIWLEVSLSLAGFVVPLLLIEMFYITVLNKWRYAFLAALVVCNIVDNLLGYTSLPAVGFVIIVASFWRNIGDCSKVELQFFPISITVFFGMLITYFTLYLKYDAIMPIKSWLYHLIGSVLVTVFLAPLMIRLQDWLAGKLKMVTYQDVQREEMYSAN